MLSRLTRIAPIILVLSLLPLPLAADQGFEPADDPADDYPIGDVAVTFNPLGFVQFGPILGLEVGVTDDLVATVHTRLVPLGVLSWLIAADEADGVPDELSGFAFGGGLLRFFGTEQNKPYLGGMLEFASTDALYLQGDFFEWEEQTTAFVMIANGGYRFRFDGGFFLNTGAFLGAAFSSWEWDYTDGSGGGSGSGPTPFGMLELTLGMEF